tara:strand:+ start:3332 stop:3616 length:285 start_codon:yes stop_codon:yes gene_type:complete
MSKPYIDKPFEQEGTGQKYLIRTFDENLKESELVWHRDLQNRNIHVLDGKGWKLQMDDKLPTELKIGKEYYIAKMSYHRLIKGENNLILRIKEI